MSSMERTGGTWRGERVIASILSTLGNALHGLDGTRVSSHQMSMMRPAHLQSELFARATGERSNTAIDWLYYAAQLRDESERRYCIDQAFAIGYNDETVMREIRRLQGW